MGTHKYGRIVELPDAVRAVESGALGLADGRHYLLLLRHSVSDDVGDHAPLGHCCRNHLFKGAGDINPTE